MIVDLPRSVSRVSSHQCDNEPPAQRRLVAFHDEVYPFAEIGDAHSEQTGCDDIDHGLRGIVQLIIQRFRWRTESSVRQARSTSPCVIRRADRPTDPGGRLSGVEMAASIRPAFNAR